MQQTKDSTIGFDSNILIYKNPEIMAAKTSRAPEAVVPWAAEEEQLLVQVPLWHL